MPVNDHRSTITDDAFTNAGFYRLAGGSFRSVIFEAPTEG
jgi:hypothetical protein